MWQGRPPLLRLQAGLKRRVPRRLLARLRQPQPKLRLKRQLLPLALPQTLQLVRAARPMLLLPTKTWKQQLRMGE
jgi:hypothetical protein